MNKILVPLLMILIAGPVRAMNDDSDTETVPHDIELGVIQSHHSSDRSQTAYDDNVLRYRGGPINRAVTPSDDSEISYDYDNNDYHSDYDSHRRDENRRPIITVQVPAQNNADLNERLSAIGDKLGNVKSVLERIRWSKFTEQLSQPCYVIGLICMICSAGRGIQDAIANVSYNFGNSISDLNPACHCQCSCPACPTAPTPMQMMYNDTMNSTVNSMNSTSNSTATNSTTFLAMMNNMTKQKTD